MFQATCPQIKNRWVNVIEKLLWTQALKNREYRLTELTTMGVGNKPSLDLKKSADNINDRFIPSLGKSSNIAGMITNIGILVCKKEDPTNEEEYITKSQGQSNLGQNLNPLVFKIMLLMRCVTYVKDMLGTYI